MTFTAKVNEEQQQLTQGKSVPVALFYLSSTPFFH